MFSVKFSRIFQNNKFVERFQVDFFVIRKISELNDSNDSCLFFYIFVYLFICLFIDNLAFSDYFSVRLELLLNNCY